MGIPQETVITAVTALEKINSLAYGLTGEENDFITWTVTTIANSITPDRMVDAGEYQAAYYSNADTNRIDLRQANAFIDDHPGWRNCYTRDDIASQNKWINEYRLWSQIGEVIAKKLNLNAPNFEKYPLIMQCHGHETHSLQSLFIPPSETVTDGPPELSQPQTAEQWGLDNESRASKCTDSFYVENGYVSLQYIKKQGSAHCRIFKDVCVGDPEKIKLEICQDYLEQVEWVKK